jgi:hypothetical protein
LVTRQTTQKVQVGARRSSGNDTVRLTARPGLDAVVLHIANGPSLMLHPETARDLMLAQTGLTRSATRSARSVGSGPAEVDIPAQLVWQGLEQAGGAGATRGASRGRLGQVLLSGIEIVTGLLTEPAAKLTASKIGARVDGQVDPGVYRLNADAFGAPLKGSGQKLDRIPGTAAAGDPMLVLLHGTFSGPTAPSAIWQQHLQKVRELFATTASVYGLDHPTLTASPIDNALARTRPADGAVWWRQCWPTCVPSRSWTRPRSLPSRTRPTRSNTRRCATWPPSSRAATSASSAWCAWPARRAARCSPPSGWTPMCRC